MRPVLIFTHFDDRRTGLVGDALELAGCSMVQANPADGIPAWSIDGISAIVSFGGRLNAQEADRDPFLAAEVALMREALARETPVLGFCLGAQLLAVASGGEVWRLGRTLVGWPRLSPLPAAREDPLFGALRGGLHVLEWHQDAIAAGSDAVLLATTSGPGDALYRVGPSAWGSQAHIEVSQAMLLDGWLADKAGIADVEAMAYEIDAFRDEARAHLAVQTEAARAVFERFGQLVSARERLLDQAQAAY
jgi:GMP synthase (glutamine-hydrolysing)